MAAFGRAMKPGELNVAVVRAMFIDRARETFPATGGQSGFGGRR
jgi:hypothetical protein